MRLNKLLVVSLIVLAILTISAVSATDENLTSDELAVSEDLDFESSVDEDLSLEDSELGVNSPGNFSDLSELIYNTPENGTLDLDMDFVNDRSSSLSISKPITINGNGHSLDGKKKSLFSIYAANVTLKNIVFKNCYDDESVGSAIYWSGQNGTLDNCSFIDCSSYGSGGAVYWYGHDGTLNDCSFIDCFSYGDGGAVYFCYSGNVCDCRFIGCQADCGGAIYFAYSSNVSDSRFVNCSHEAIFGWRGFNLVNLSFVNCALGSNEEYNCSNVFIDGIEHKYVKLEFKDDEYFYLPKDSIFYSKISIDAKNCIIDGQGSTIAAKVDINGLNVTIKNVVFKNAEIYSSNMYTTMINCSIINTWATFDESYASISDSRFSNGKISINNKYGNVVNCNFTGNYAYGAISIQSASLNCTVENCSFVDCSSEDREYIVISTTGNKVKNCYFFNCSSKEGSVIHFMENQNVLNGVVENCTFMLISAEYVISNYRGHYGVVDSTFEFVNCSETPIDSPESVVGCSFVNCSGRIGGAISVVFNNGQIENCSFQNCVAQTGNAIYRGSANNCTFINYKNSTDAVYGTKLENCSFVTKSVVNPTNGNASNQNTTVIISSKITSSDVNTVYDGGKYLYATLKDINGKVIVGVKVTVKFSNGKTVDRTTDKNGQIKVTTDDLAPKTYTATITFAGNAKYAKYTTKVNVVVKKATPKLTASKKTFKKSVKTKKYTVTLKTNKNKVMKNTWVTLKVNKKTYKAKTNNKGQATFKITNLKKKGTFTAVVKYAGSKYYNAKTVKPKIVVK